MTTSAMNQASKMKPVHLKMLASSVLLLLGFSSMASADELADVKAKGQLVCGTLSTAEPVGFVDAKTRQVVGFDVDICQGVADQLGVKMVQKTLSVEARIPELEVGRVDILSAAMGYTVDREKQIDFSSSHFQNPLKVLAPAAAGYKTLADLNGKRVATAAGSDSEYYIHKYFPKITVVTYQDAPSAFLALEQRKVSGYASSQTAGVRYLQAGKGKFAFVDQAIAWEPNALGIRKGQPAFLAAVNNALANMEKSGQLEAIWNKWLGDKTIYKMKRVYKLEPISQVRDSAK